MKQGFLTLPQMKLADDLEVSGLLVIFKVEGGYSLALQTATAQWWYASQRKPKMAKLFKTLDAVYSLIEDANFPWKVELVGDFKLRLGK